MKYKQLIYALLVILVVSSCSAVERTTAIPTEQPTVTPTQVVVPDANDNWYQFGAGGDGELTWGGMWCWDPDKSEYCGSSIIVEFGNQSQKDSRSGGELPSFSFDDNGNKRMITFTIYNKELWVHVERSNP